MKNVLITSKLPGKAVERLRDFCNVRVLTPQGTLSAEELQNELQDCDGVISLLSDPFTREVITNSPRLKVIANYAVGFNNIDVEAATEQGVLVTNTPDVLTETSADLAWALLMSTARRVVEGDTLTRGGQFTGWAPELLLGTDVFGKTLGIIGAGRIGRAVAKRAIGFGMRVLYFNRTRLSDSIEEQFALEFSELENLLRQSDFVSLHCPLTPTTKHLIGSAELKMMKPTAVLINTARGPVVDEKALVSALQSGDIFGAGLDVFEQEPKLESGLAELSNVVLTPHIASASVETRHKMVEMTVDSIIDGLEGRKPQHLVNQSVWKKQK